MGYTGEAAEPRGLRKDAETVSGMFGKKKKSGFLHDLKSFFGFRNRPRRGPR